MSIRDALEHQNHLQKMFRTRTYKMRKCSSHLAKNNLNYYTFRQFCLFFSRLFLFFSSSLPCSRAIVIVIYYSIFFSHEIISDHCFHYTHHENVFVIQILYNKPLYCNLWTLDHTRSRKSLERKENRQQNWHHIIFAVRDFLLLFSRLLFLQPQKVHFLTFVF